MPKTRPSHATAYSRIAPLVWIALFTGLLLVLELLNLYDEGWDESTFIIMASDVLKGNLPYLELYDLKPPGFFSSWRASWACSVSPCRPCTCSEPSVYW